MKCNYPECANEAAPNQPDGGGNFCTTHADEYLKLLEKGDAERIDKFWRIVARNGPMEPFMRMMMIRQSAMIGTLIDRAAYRPAPKYFDR